MSWQGLNGRLGLKGLYEHEPEHEHEHEHGHVEPKPLIFKVRPVL
jgi:hypothetical protein